MFNTLTKALCEIVSIIQVIPSFFVFNKPLEIPSYFPLFSQWYKAQFVFVYSYEELINGATILILLQYATYCKAKEASPDQRKVIKIGLGLVAASLNFPSL